MPDCGVHYLWFAFVCFLIRSPPPPPNVHGTAAAACPTPVCASSAQVFTEEFFIDPAGTGTQMADLHAFVMSHNKYEDFLSEMRSLSIAGVPPRPRPVWRRRVQWRCFFQFRTVGNAVGGWRLPGWR